MEYEVFGTLSKNIDKIVQLYPATAIEFLENLKKFISDLKQESIILENKGYLVP